MARLPVQKADDTPENFRDVDVDLIRAEAASDLNKALRRSE